MTTYLLQVCKDRGGCSFCMLISLNVMITNQNRRHDENISKTVWYQCTI